MRSFDLSPLFRSSIGFDRMTRLLDAATRVDENAVSYPPYNIEVVGENAYRITMAVAGFSEKDVSITAQDNQLVIAGKTEKNGEDERKFLYRGIAGRAFERRFELAEHIQVVSASLVNGLLHVELVREVPEARKPRQIKVDAGAVDLQPRRTTIEAKAEKAA